MARATAATAAAVGLLIDSAVFARSASSAELWADEEEAEERARDDDMRLKRNARRRQAYAARRGGGGWFQLRHQSFASNRNLMRAER